MPSHHNFLTIISTSLISLGIVLIVIANALKNKLFLFNSGLRLFLLGVVFIPVSRLIKN